MSWLFDPNPEPEREPAPVTASADAVEPPPAGGPPVEPHFRAFDEGAAAARRGLPVGANPYPRGRDEDGERRLLHDCWNNGHAVERDRMAGLTDDPPKLKTTRRRRR